MLTAALSASCRCRSTTRIPDGYRSSTQTHTSRAHGVVVCAVSTGREAIAPFEPSLRSPSSSARSAPVATTTTAATQCRTAHRRAGRARLRRRRARVGPHPPTRHRPPRTSRRRPTHPSPRWRWTPWPPRSRASSTPRWCRRRSPGTQRASMSARPAPSPPCAPRAVRTSSWRPGRALTVTGSTPRRRSTSDR